MLTWSHFPRPFAPSCQASKLMVRWVLFEDPREFSVLFFGKPCGGCFLVTPKRCFFYRAKICNLRYSRSFTNSTKSVIHKKWYFGTWETQFLRPAPTNLPSRELGTKIFRKKSRWYVQSCFGFIPFFHLPLTISAGFTAILSSSPRVHLGA